MAAAGSPGSGGSQDGRDEYVTGVTSLSSCASDETSQYVTASTETLAAIQTSREQGWTEVADHVREGAAGASSPGLSMKDRLLWEQLKKEAPRIFVDWGERVKLGRLIAEGGEAHIYEAWIDDSEEDLVAKVFKVKGFSLGELHRQWPRKRKNKKSQTTLHRLAIHQTTVVGKAVEVLYISSVRHGLFLKDGAFAFLGKKYAGDLRTLINSRVEESNHQRSPFPYKQMIRIMLEIAAGMKYLHERGVLHRDLKAANILYSNQISELSLDGGESSFDSDESFSDEDDLPRDEDELPRDEGELRRDEDELPLDEDESFSSKDKLFFHEDEFPLDKGELRLEEDELTSYDDKSSFDEDNSSSCRDELSVYEDELSFHEDKSSSDEEELSLAEDDSSPATNIHCVVADYESSAFIQGTGFWRAPEVLEDLSKKLCERNKEIWTEKVDVYSYAMTCYEVMTGATPFPHYRKSDWHKVIDGERPRLPNYVYPNYVHLRQLVERCWHSEPLKRPTFDDIEKRLDLLASNGGLVLLKKTFQSVEGFDETMDIWQARDHGG